MQVDCEMVSRRPSGRNVSRSKAQEFYFAKLAEMSGMTTNLSDDDAVRNLEELVHRRVDESNANPRETYMDKLLLL
jgi:hypothetical protein